MLILTGQHGGLCNRLFAFANVIAFATEHGLTVANPGFGEFAEAFPSLSGDALCRYPGCRIGKRASRRARSMVSVAVRAAFRANRRVRWWPNCALDWSERFRFDAPESAALVERLRTARLAFLDGFYFLAGTPFATHAAEIRAFFQPNAMVAGRVADVVAQARGLGDVLVGVHVRQGDFRQHHGGLYHYTPAEVAATMDQVGTLFPGRRVAFLVCSDEPPASEAFARFATVFGPGGAVEDVYALAACDWLVGPPSTFSQWASFHGKVPRYLINDKEKRRHGLPSTPPTLAEFKVFRSGETGRDE